jgi:hypothetical protein
MCLPDDGGCKIGLSRDPARRCKTIQIGNARAVKLFWVLQLEKDLARKVERAAHTRLRATEAHSSGEWYWLDAMTAVEVVRSIARDLTRATKSDSLSPISKI